MGGKKKGLSQGGTSWQNPLVVERGGDATFVKSQELQYRECGACVKGRGSGKGGCRGQKLIGLPLWGWDEVTGGKIWGKKGK